MAVVVVEVVVVDVSDVLGCQCPVAEADTFVRVVEEVMVTVWTRWTCSQYDAALVWTSVWWLWWVWWGG